MTNTVIVGHSRYCDDTISWYAPILPVPSHTRFTQKFFCQNPSAANVIELFEFLPHVFFFAKDSEGRFVKANQPFLYSLGVDDESEIVGKTAREFIRLDWPNRKWRMNSA